jgi:hypothetical protein
MDIIQPSVSPKIINNAAVMAAAVGASIANGTGTLLAPGALVTGANAPVVTGAGNFLVTIPANCIGTAISGPVAVVTGSPVLLNPGVNTIAVVGVGVITVIVSVVNILVTIPGIQTGYLKRLAINNTAAIPANLITADVYTPDSSNGNPNPVETIKLRYPVYITASDWIDIDGHTISKHMGTLAIVCDTPGVIVGYVLSLE